MTLCQHWKKKSCIREIPTPSTDADSRTNTPPTTTTTTTIW